MVTLLSLENDGPRSIATLSPAVSYDGGVLEIEEDGSITYITMDPSTYLRGRLPQ